MNKLRSHCLDFKELLAQNIALISPTMTAALIVPLMYGTTGSISWLSYAVGAVLVLFVALSFLNQFAKRTTNSGSMYSYAMSGLGFGGGAMCGWCLMWAYLFHRTRRHDRVYGVCQHTVKDDAHQRSTSVSVRRFVSGPVFTSLIKTSRFPPW